MHAVCPLCMMSSVANTSVAVDLNPSQSALLELKLAAIKHLNYEDYLLLLGENEDPLNQRYVADIYCAKTLVLPQPHFWVEVCPIEVLLL